MTNSALVDRLVVALHPSPATRDLVARHIVALAGELDAETMGGIVTAVENPEGIGATELAQRAGITYRQVNHWTTLGYLAPTPGESGSGNPRVYPVTTVAKARVMGSIVTLFGMTLDKASDLAEEIVARGRATVGPFTVTRDGNLG